MQFQSTSERRNLQGVSKPLGTWDRHVLASQIRPHFMQSDTWRTFRDLSDWESSQFSARLGDEREFNYQTFTRSIPGLGSIEHAPRVAGIHERNIGAFTDHVRNRSGASFAFKLELFQERDEELEAMFLENGWLPCRASQYRFAVDVDLSGSWEQVSARMKRRARNEFRAGLKAGVVVERVALTKTNVETMLRLVEETRNRTSAFFRSDDYLTNSWHIFEASGQGELWFARVNQDIVAGAFVFTFGPTAWYKDGGSTRTGSKTFAARVLHTEIMRSLNARGYVRYELGNVPAPESNPSGASAGLLTFKGAYSRHVVEYMPAFEYPFRWQAKIWRANESRFVRLYSALSRDYWY